MPPSAPGVAEVGTAIGGAAPVGAQAVFNARNMDYLKKATKVYQKNPTNANANYLGRVYAVLNTNEHLADNIARSIDNNYDRLFPQRPWYRFWQR